MNKGQIILVRTLLNKLGYDESDKEELVYNHTNGRTTSLREMNQTETKSLINTINQITHPEKLKRDRMIGKILSMAHEMHWELSDGKVDMVHLDNFCLKSTPQKKRLRDFTTAELPSLVTLIEKVHFSFIKSL